MKTFVSCIISVDDILFYWSKIRYRLGGAPWIAALRAEWNRLEWKWNGERTRVEWKLATCARGSCSSRCPCGRRGRGYFRLPRCWRRSATNCVLRCASSADQTSPKHTSIVVQSRTWNIILQQSNRAHSTSCHWLPYENSDVISFNFQELN